MSQWKTINIDTESAISRTEVFKEIISILEDFEIDYFYVLLYENESNIVKIRILKENYKKLLPTLRKYNSSEIYFNDDYAAEVKRYGGLQNIDFVESIFCEASSITAYALYNNTIEERILLAIELNSLLFSNLNVSNKSLKELYEFLSETWLIFSYNSFNIKIKNIDKLSYSLQSQLSNYSLNKKSELLNYKKLIKNIDNLHYKDYHQENPNYSLNLVKKVSNLKIDKPLFNTIISLAHMNFNKLGLFPHIESTVYKILSK